MIIIDANLLLYAYHADAPQQRLAAEWLRKLLRSGEIVGLPWVTVWAFIRISPMQESGPIRNRRRKRLRP
jgi:predicted nucleic acid-binding protein